jgi:ankyrin repeat protein
MFCLQGGYSSLHFAVAEGHVDVVESLMAHPDFNINLKVHVCFFGAVTGLFFFLSAFGLEIHSFSTP